MSSEPSSDDTEYSAENIDEARIKEIAERVAAEQVQEELAATDPDGKRVSASDFLNIGLTRRQALYATGLVATGYSVTQAAVSAMSESAEAAAGTGNLGTESDPLDTIYANNLGSSAEPVQSATVESLDTGELSRNKSHRQGSIVYYDPRGRGPYVDGADALADVPAGGTFVLATTTYDVASEGSLVVTANPGKSIVGNGPGSKIVNTGSDSVAGPVVGFDPSSGKVRDHVLRDFSVEHDDTGPAVEVRNAPANSIKRLDVDAMDSAPKGIRLGAATYNSDVTDCRSRRATGANYEADSAGQLFYFIRCVASGANGQTGLRALCEHPVVYGGTYSPEGTGSIGIELRNDSGSGYHNADIRGTYHEYVETAIDVNTAGTNKYRRVNIEAPRLQLGHHTDGVYFGDSANSYLRNPMVKGTGGNLVHWSANSSFDGIVTDGAAAGEAMADDGAYIPHVIVPSAATNARVSGINTGSWYIWVAYDTDQNSPVFHNGSSWYDQSSANATFTP
jgi:hypothetical protein